MSRNPTRFDITRALFVGATAGLAASFVMNVFQEAVEHFGPDDGGDDSGAEPATVQAAEGLASMVGADLPKAFRPAAGSAIHYAFGAMLGAGYAVMAEYEPRAAAGAGAGFGVTTAIVMDEAAVPAAGLSDAPWTFPLGTHAYALVSHLVFGMTVDAVRRGLYRAMLRVRF
ncbi:DUF1440 domain-containing protein [Sphingomonas prati]|uniref:Putative membrane protein YagU involved in acid resistance n=1 Tax=Sphingomonas prati TaxID=1843237 RepID=A0A7W9BTA3_9SPHN|nr:DUF1440 domain-containing protein [Sphingomonas prati]MBB5729626.1 putative membrane protein YagU involved in acid resistance [Sphingomonas prati]GGE76015.1 hypothetical protein GCM10011404_05790 [Sphingomonas prati]